MKSTDRAQEKTYNLAMTRLSVIIPLAPNETAWQSLLADLDKLPDGTEILFVKSESSNTNIDETPVLAKKEIKILIDQQPGRAAHMNAGAAKAQGKYLWFLHADSKFGPDTLTALLRAITHHPHSLLYFDLAFLKDASFLMCINNWGVYFRSRVLKLPFGDQGFCISKALFTRIGGFLDGLNYGEDHVFVWRARQQGIRVQPVGARLYTSARKYKKHGWLKTTLLHQYLWIKQAWPEWKKLKQGRTA